MSDTHQLDLTTSRTKSVRFASLCCFLIAGLAISDMAIADPKAIVLEQTRLYVESLITQAHPNAARIQIKIRSPDARISLEACIDADISTHGQQRLGNRILIKLKCGPVQVIHLAVDLSVYKEVVVAATALHRQKLLGINDITLQEIDVLSNRRVFFHDLNLVKGKKLKRSVAAGTILTAGMLAKPSIINKGDSVVIIAKKGSIVVSQPGIALESGTMGDQIRVKNESSGKIVRGWVRGPGEIHVPV